MTRWTLACFAACFAGTLACGSDSSPAPTGPAGKVLGVEGDVTATRAGGEARALEVHGVVFGNDTIRTGEGGSVSIHLDHNGAVWRLGPNAESAVHKSAAWRVEPRAGTLASALADDGDDRTAAAGRHAERQAAQIGTRSGESGARVGEPTAGTEAQGATGGPSPVGEGIGLGTAGTLGHGAGKRDGYGSGAGNRSVAPRPRPVVDAVRVAGPLPVEVMRRLLRQMSVKFARCAERAVTDKMYQGAVRIQFDASPAGVVSGVTVTPNPASDTIETCLRTAVRTLRTPEAGAVSRVEADVTFAVPAQ